MKTRLIIPICIITTLVLLPACQLPDSRSTTDGLNVVTTFYPLWYMASEIAGDSAEVTNLAGSTDVHDYTPSPQDIVQLNEADLVIYQGAGLEPWIEDLLAELEAEGVELLEATHELGLHEDEHKDEHEDEHEDGHHHHTGIDPHTWLDPVLAQQMAESIRQALIEIDPDNEQDYEDNAADLIARYEELDQDYQQALDQCTIGEAIVSHDAFGYLEERYDFTLHSIAGLSTADEPSAQLLAELQDEAAEGMTHILAEQSSVTRFAETLAAETSLTMLPINPLGRGTLDEDKDFFDIAYENLAALQTALGCDE